MIEHYHRFVGDLRYIDLRSVESDLEAQYNESLITMGVYINQNGDPIEWPEFVRATNLLEIITPYVFDKILSQNETAYLQEWGSPWLGFFRAYINTDRFPSAKIDIKKDDDCVYVMEVGDITKIFAPPPTFKTADEFRIYANREMGVEIEE